MLKYQFYDFSPFFYSFFFFSKTFETKMEVSLESINGRCAILGVKLCINDPDHARLLGTSGRDRKYFTDLEKALSNHIYHCFKTKMPVDRFSFCKCQVFRSSSYPLPNQQVTTSHADSWHACTCIACTQHWLIEIQEIF